MKKITGKVVSLVLALALVVTSFSANFAFAASKKTLSGTISGTDHDEIYLVNNDGSNNDVTGIKDWIKGTTDSKFKLETKDHGVANDPEILAVSHVSGDKLVSVDVDDGDATLKLKNKSGKEVLSVLFGGDYTDPDDDNDTEYTVKGRTTFTIYAYDQGDIVFGEKKDNDAGEGLDEFKTFAMNKNAKKTIGIYKAVQDSGSPLAEFETVQLVDAKDKITIADSTKAGNVYSYEMTGGEDYVHLQKDVEPLPTAGEDGKTVADGEAVNSELAVIVGKNEIMSTDETPVGTGLYKDDAKTGSVTINVKKLEYDEDDGIYKASKESEDKFTLKTKIEKKIDVEAITGSVPAVDISIKKGSGSTTILTGKDLGETNVKNCEVIFPATYANNVSVGEKTDVSKISGELGTLKISDGKVGTVDLDKGNVDVTGGTVGDITTDDGTVTVNGDEAVVGNIDNTDASSKDVEVKAGTVGDIDSDSAVIVTSDDEDVAVSVGTITAPYATITSDDAKLTVKGLVISADAGKTTIKGESKLSVGTIDADYYETEFAFGDDSDDAFVGTVPAPKNAKKATVSTENEDTVLTVTGDLTADTVSIDSDTSATFTGSVNVKNIDGDGTLKIAAGKLYVSESASNVTLKLSDATLTPGTTVFKADKDAVDVDDMDTFGFTLDVSSGNDVDTFKIKTISFAGIVINKTSSKIAKGYSETFTASAYPTGTALPAGATIKWELDGGSEDVFTLTTTGNTAKVDIVSLDKDFESENKTTLTATLYDEDGDEMDDYDAATCDITALAVPEAASDTNNDFSVAKGSTYQFKITSATAPTFTTGTAGVFSVALASVKGNEYYYKITAIGNVGAATGIYLNGNKLLVATVKAPAFTTDTTKDMTVKGAYTIKVTAAATPTFALGTPGVFNAAFVSKTGNDYLYKITSVGAAGAKTGVYVNGVKTFVATVG
jgi:hypothetical protein